MLLNRYSWFQFVGSISLLILAFMVTSCKKEDDLSDDEDDLIQHTSVLNSNSGWSSLAFDSEVFYPYGGFAGPKRINISQAFVHNGHPNALTSIEYAGASNSSYIGNVSTVKNGEVVRLPISGSGEFVIGKEHLYRYLENDEKKCFVRRLNGPDYSSYNSFQWPVDNIEREVRNLGHRVGNYISSGTPDFIYLNDTLNAIQATYLIISENGTEATQQKVVISRTDISRNNTGYVKEIEISPYHQDLAQNYYLDLRTKYLKGKTLTLAFGTEQRNAYLLFGAFDDGFTYVKMVENVRGITAFFKGKDNFFCVLKESGSGRNYAYKIDLNGNVSDLGIIESAYDESFTHYKGDLVYSHIKNENTDNEKNVVEKVTASGRELLGSSPLTKPNCRITHLMSDGNQLFGAGINKISPVYQGGGRQFEGWEFIKYNQ